MDVETYAKLTPEKQVEYAVQQLAHHLLVPGTRVLSAEEWEAAMRERAAPQDLPAAE